MSDVLEWAKVVVPTAAVFAGVGQFLWGQRAQRRRDFETRRWADQRNAYSAVAKVVGKAAAAPDQAAVLYPEFMALYWGEMIFVEDSDVESAMVEFEQRFRAFAENPAEPDEFSGAGYELIKTLADSSDAKIAKAR